MDVVAWLRDLGLERYADAFLGHEIDANLLPTLTAEDLKDLGVGVVGHRRRILNAIAELKAPEPADVQATRAVARTPKPTEAQRRQLTVLFCDLVGSTELSERFDPEDMGALIRSYQERSAEVIKRWEGHVARYMGDGVLAYFGYPQAHEDDPERAVRAGLDLIDEIGRIITPQGDPLGGRVGIATGLVVVGDLVGEDEAIERSVVGATPNLAARLQALAGPGEVMIAPDTRRLIGELFELHDLGPTRLKGFDEAVRAWRVVASDRAADRFEAMRIGDLTPLFGREEELQLLISRWQRAREGEGQVVVLSGEPGIGKSRLSRALWDTLRDEQHTRLVYYCSPYHTDSPLHPVLEQIEHAASIKRSDPPEARLDKLEALLALGTRRVTEAAALIGPLLSIPIGTRYPPSTLSPKLRKERTFDALIDQLEGLAARVPVVVQIEDAHWIDPSTAELVDRTVEQIQRLPVLLLITGRPEYRPPWPGHAHITQLSLNRLGERQAASMIQHLTQGNALPAAVLARILERTDGVPLFVEELTRMLVESGFFVPDGDPPPGGDAVLIPATLQDSLLARLDRLAPVKEVAQTGAVIGRVFSYDLLAAVIQMGNGTLEESLDQLVGAGLIFRQGRGEEATYSFKHALVRDAAYQSLLKRRRRDLHARVAQALETGFPLIAAAKPELLAQHFASSGQRERAIRYWQQAGQQAVGRSTPIEAVEHVNKGLALLEALEATPERARLELDLQTVLGPALMAAKGQGAREVGAAYTRALELCREIGTPGDLFPISWGLWRFSSVRAQHRRARQLAEQGLALAESLGDPEPIMAACSALGGTLLWLGETAAAKVQLERGAAISEAHPKRVAIHRFGQDPGVSCLSYSSWALFGLGFPDRAARQSRAALALAEDLDHPISLAAARVYAAITHQLLRDVAASRSEAERAIQLSEAHGFPQFQTVGMILRGWALAHDGPPEEGLAMMQAGLAARRAQGIELARPWYLALIADGALERGDATVGLAAVDEASGLPDRGFYLPELHRLKGELMLLPGGPGDPNAAEACFQQALDAARARGTRSWELRAARSLGRLWANDGKRRAAEDLLAAVLEGFDEGLTTADLVDAGRLLADLRG